jgi:hypothetical protein
MSCGLNPRAGLGFPGCPAADCIIPVGLTLGAITVSSPAVSGTWAATLDIANGTTVVKLASGSCASLPLHSTAVGFQATKQLRSKRMP